MLEWMLFKLEMFHKSLTELPRPGSEESKEREVPAQLQSMAATFNQRRRCSKLRKALQEFVKLPLLAKVEFDYLDCSSDPTRSMNDIHSTILRDFAAKFKGALSTRVPLSEVSDFEDVAINCAESVVWKNLQSIREDIGLHIMIAKDLLWLLEDASHEVPLFVAADENPLRVWEIFSAANVQKQRFCALAVYESAQQFTCGKKLVESLMTTRLWDTMLERFKSAELHLAEHEMIDSQDLEWKLEFFRDKLHELQRRWEKWALPTIFNEGCFCSESCTGCGRGLWDVSGVWINHHVDTTLGKSRPMYPRYPQSKGREPFHDEFRFQLSLRELTKVMSDLTDTASEIANSLPAPKPSEDAESSQDSFLGSWDKVVSSPSSIASTSKEERCAKLREALQKMSKVRVLVAYGNYSWDTRSGSERIRPIVKDFVSKFQATWPNDLNCAPLSEVSDVEDVALNWAESLVWKPLRSSCEDTGCCKGTDSLCMIAKDLLCLLEDASHEVPFFDDAEANPLKIWQIFVAANVQRQRFCTVAAYEKEYTRGKKFVEGSMTARLWDTMLSHFKRAQVHLAEHEMIDSDLQSQLEDFRQILHDLRSHLQHSLYVGRLTQLMSDLTAAASKIANSLPAPNPSEDAERNQESSSGWGGLASDQADQETLRPDESASQVGDGSASSDSCTLVSAVGGPHCFLPCYLFRVPGQVEETSFISGKDTGEESIVDDDEE